MVIEDAANNVDSILILSFGGPEGKDDVLPFLRNVTKGKRIPEHRLEEVVKQYALFDGVSPLNAHCRELKILLEEELTRANISLPIYWGNRNWNPMLQETVAEMTRDGKKKALVFATSAFSSYSGCRQYQQNLCDAAEQVLHLGSQPPELQKLRLFYNHPGFIEPLCENLTAGLAKQSATARIIFTAHSIPVSMAETSEYENQLAESARLIMETTENPDRPYDIVFQSRSGPPHMPWLEPDINDHLTRLAAEGVTEVTVLPLGFTSDHMEVLFDLDTQAKQTAKELGIAFQRISTVGNHPLFITMIRQLIEEQILDSTPLALGDHEPWPDQCPEGHCLPVQ